MEPYIQPQERMITSRVNPQACRSLVGSFIYLTRYLLHCKLCFKIYGPMQISPLSSYQKILKYLNKTLGYGLFLPVENKIKLCTYANADWRHNLDKRLTFSKLHKLGKSSIFWNTGMQTTLFLLRTIAK